MSQYLIRRTLQAIPLLLATSVIIFLLVRLAPGGPLAAAERNPYVIRILSFVCLSIPI